MKNKKELILSNINLANKMASSKKRLLSHVHYEDLQSAAYLGLVEAANNFDNNKNVCFEIFATWRIKGAIKDYLREINWGTRRKPVFAYNIEELRI
jgi:RNA polymerase sigma factor for flagellar operon FliA